MTHFSIEFPFLLDEPGDVVAIGVLLFIGLGCLQWAVSVVGNHNLQVMYVSRELYPLIGYHKLSGGKNEWIAEVKDEKESCPLASFDSLSIITHSECFWLAARNRLLWRLLPAAAKLRQSCPTLCDPRYGNPAGSPVLGILQARTLEWVAISFSNAWKWKVKLKSLSRVWLLATPWTAAYQAPPSMGFFRQEYWSGVPLPSPDCFLNGVNLSNIVRCLWFSIEYY